MKKESLKKSELSELKGGIRNTMQVLVEKKNTNDTSTCVCTYPNTDSPGITNSNSCDGCVCTCV